MRRLTRKDDRGNWHVEGLLWEKLHEGATITGEIWEKLYGCLCKLKDYEDTGLSPDDVERVNDFTRSEACKLLKKLNEEQKKHRWLPADEPPETDDYILLSFENYSIPLVGRYEVDNEGGAYYVGDDTESCISADLYVNAWMPLPEPYRPEK